MLELKGLSGVFYTMSEWIMRLSALNLLWFGLSLPFFILFVTVEMSSMDGLLFFGTAGWLLASFLFFPATAAVFAVARSWIVDEDFSSVIKNYFFHLKADYKENILLGAIFSSMWLVWYYGYFYFYMAQSDVAVPLLAAGIALFIYTINFLSISSHYRMSVTVKMKNAFFITVGRPLMSLFIALISGILLWVSTTQLLWLFPLMTCSMIAFMAFSAFHRVAREVTAKKVSNDAG